MDSCAACGCEITGTHTPSGAAVHHAGKLYCGECAAMILPPETLEKLVNAAKPAAGASARPGGGVMSGDDILGEEVLDDTASHPSTGNVPPARHETSAGIHRASTRAAQRGGRGGGGGPQ